MRHMHSHNLHTAALAITSQLKLLTCTACKGNVNVEGKFSKVAEAKARQS